MVKTRSEQILEASLQSQDPLEQEVAGAMLSENLLEVLAEVIGDHFQKSKEQVLDDFCVAVNAGEHDEQLVQFYLQARPELTVSQLKENVGGRLQLPSKEDSYAYWFIENIESYFNFLYPQFQSTPVLAHSDPRIKEAITLKTLNRIIGKTRENCQA